MSIRKGRVSIAGAPKDVVWGGIEGTITDQLDLKNALDSKISGTNANLTGTPTAPTASKGVSNNQIATTAFVQRAVEDIDALPPQEGQAGKYLTTNGTAASWGEVTSMPETDNTTISVSSQNKLQAIGIINKNGNAAKYDWVGTLAQYNALGTYNDSWTYFITDDESDNSFVHIAGNETIGGVKTFTSVPVFSGGSGGNEGGEIELSKAPNGSTKGIVDVQTSGSGDCVRLRMDGNTGLMVYSNGLVKTSLQPTEDTTSSYQVDTVGARNTKLANYALDNSVVKLTGNQEISGVKKFTGYLWTESSSSTDTKTNFLQMHNKKYKISDTSATSNVDTQMVFYDANDDWTGYVSHRFETSGESGVFMVARKKDKSTSSAIGLRYDNSGNVNTYAPTPPNSSNDNNIATTAFIRNILTTIYPIGCVYLSTTSTCPLAALFGTWQNIGTQIMTNASASGTAPVKGNGMTVGWTNGTSYAGTTTGSARMEPTAHSYGQSVTTAGQAEDIISGCIGITTDGSKSGMVVDISSALSTSSITVNIFKRTA